MSVAAVWRRSWKRIFDFSGRGQSFIWQRGQCRSFESACRSTWGVPFALQRPAGVVVSGHKAEARES